MKGIHIFFGGVILLVLLVVGGSFFFSAQPGRLDSFAQCLADKQVKFYGAFWCPHCQAQKALFGRSAKLLPYIECSTPDGKDQLQVCKDENIQGYPTWVFASGERIAQELSLEQLAEKSGCALPQ